LIRKHECVIAVVPHEAGEQGLESDRRLLEAIADHAAAEVHDDPESHDFQRACRRHALLDPVVFDDEVTGRELGDRLAVVLGQYVDPDEVDARLEQLWLEYAVEGDEAE
jgi:hypothetical protein